MTSSATLAKQDGEHVKENTTVTTIHRIYREPDDLILRDPNNRRSFINRSAYAKLHRSFSSGSNRHSVDNLKGRFESFGRQDSKGETKEERSQPEVKTETIEEPTSPIEEFTPASFGYPRTAKLVPPLIKPKPIVTKRKPKDENSNVVSQTSESSDADEVRIVLQPTASQDSVDKIAKELSNFTMDGKPKDRKRSGSFKKFFGLFGKDKKKKEDERNKQKSGDNIVYNDNLKNETNFSRGTSVRQSAPMQYRQKEETNQRKNERPNALQLQENHERVTRELEEQYARLHVNRFNSIRRSFNEDKTDNYVIMDNSKTKPSINDYVSTPVNKYIDTSSSASIESEKLNGVIARDTPPRAQETYQNIQVVKPKAAIPINSERPLPNPYQNEKESPRTIERNLNKSNNKDYPDKPSFRSNDDTYGTVFDSIEYAASRNGDVKHMNARPPISPPKPVLLERPPVSPSKTISLEKLRLPSNREIYEPQPRVKSPIPANKVSTEKIIATELLKNTRSPTPPKRVSSKPPEDAIIAKPPISPKSKNQEPQFDKIVTNAMVHAPRTPDSRLYTNVTPNMRSSTPVDLRMSVSMKMSPKKEDVRKSVEEYYWKQLKKLKEEEDTRLHSLQMNGYYEEQSRLRRSRSLSPHSHRAGKRSMSLPRDGRSNYVEYVRVPPPQPIPEDQALTTTDGRNRRYVYDQNFVRNNPERRSVDSLQRPIFRRGSLTKQEIYESNPYNKRVSFSSSQAAQQGWPSRNGYMQNPPQRRLERIASDADDEVFIQDPIYGNQYSQQNEPVYTNRVLEQFRAQQFENARYQQAPQMGVRRLSMDSIPRQPDFYASRAQVVRRPISNVSQFDDYGRTNAPRYPTNSQLSLQRNPVYSSRQSMTDSAYGQKQITVRNKYCDIYGQIHDSQQSGIVIGQLQGPPAVPPRQPDSFVRGSRLTASANDIGKRYNDRLYEINYNDKISYENRPLPPPPRQNSRNTHVSDTESGSDVSEIQRIMQNKTKKRGGFFGK